MKPQSEEQEPLMSGQTESVFLSKAATVQTKRTTAKATSRNGLSIRPIPGTKHVLFGRGKGYANSPGNQRMHRIIDKYRGQYIGSTRSTKRRLLRQAYDEIIKGGVKFMKQAGTQDKWIEVEAEEAIRKVGHSLRWRKGNIEEAIIPAKPIAGGSIQGRIATSDYEAARPREKQATMEQQQVPLAVNTHGLDGVLLRQAIWQQQLQAEIPGIGIPSAFLPHRAAPLVRQPYFERLPSMALIKSLPITQLLSTLATEAQISQALEWDQEFVRIMASRRQMFP